MRRPVSVLAILGDTADYGEIIEWIRRRGLMIDIATTGEEGVSLHRQHGADLVLVGLPLPDYTASSVLGGIRHNDARTPIVVVGTDHEVGSQLEAMELGAQEYVGHPVDDRRDLLFALGVSLGVRKSDALLRVLRAREAAYADWRRIVGNCPAMRQVMHRLREVCERTLSGATPTVLLGGEIGTGKRRLAKALHFNSARRNRAFCEVNCAVVGPDDLRTILFGRAEGTSRQGLLETADGGTMFIDEIGAAPLDVQKDILIALEDKLIRRGGDEPIHIDVQVIAASRRDLESMTKRGEFRADLFHRLSVTSVHLPPLRERGEDIMTIAHAMAREIAQEHGVTPPTFAPDACAVFTRHAWRGNLREMHNEIERLVLLVDDVVVTAEHLAIRRTAAVTIDATGGGLDVVVSGDRCPFEQLERELIRQALVRSSGNVSRAARFLALTRQTLLYRMKKYDFTGTTMSGDTGEV